MRKRRWLGRLFGWDGRDRVAEQPVWVAGAPAEEPIVEEPEPIVEEPEPIAEEPAPEDGTLDRDGAQAALESALEALGSAHHRPFSRG